MYLWIYYIIGRHAPQATRCCCICSAASITPKATRAVTFREPADTALGMHHERKQTFLIVNRTVDGAKAMGIIYGMGTYEKGEVEKKVAMTESNEIGKKVYIRY